MLSIIPTLSLVCTMLQFIYSTFIHISFSHWCNFFLVITCLLFKSWHKGSAMLLLLLFFLPAPGEADELSTMRNSMMIPARCMTIRMIFTITIQNPMMSLFSDHPGTHWVCGHQMIPSRQHFESKLGQLNPLLPRCNPNILSIGRVVLSWSWTMNGSLRCWHPRRYLITRFNDWIHLLVYIVTRGRIHTKPVSDWSHGKHEICGDMSPLLTSWQDSSLVPNRPTGQLFQAYWRWSWPVRSLSLSIPWCLWIFLPQMRWRLPRFIAGGMRKSRGLIQPRGTQMLRVPTVKW